MFYKVSIYDAITLISSICQGKKRKESQPFEVIKKTFAWPIPYK